MSTPEIIKKACCNMCRNGCPVEVHVRGNEVVGVSSDKDWGDGTGFRCERNIRSALEYHNHPDRLKYPLKRVGARGEGKWQRISWPQAMDEIAARIGEVSAKYGPEAVACLGGIGINNYTWTYMRWCNLFGTPNYFNITKNCYQTQMFVENAMYGSDTEIQTPVPGVTKCMVVFAGNPHAAFVSSWATFVRAKKEGAKLIVIDPRFTRTTQLADLWLQIRPGTDGALAYGMLNIIIQEELYDKEFVSKWCLGFDEVKRCVRPYSPEVVENITWIPREKIIEAARSYATMKPSQINTLWGVTHSQLGKGATLPINLGKCALRAITGNLDVKGGEPIHDDLVNFDYDAQNNWDDLINHPVRTKDNVSAEAFPAGSVRGFDLLRQGWRKVYKYGYYNDWAIAPNYSPFFLWQAIMESKPYPVKALITVGCNSLVTRTATKKIYQVLKSENLGLHVNVDHFMTPAGMLADYVMPVTDWMERPWISFSDYCPSEQSVPPAYDRRHDYDFWRELGIRLGQQQYWPETLEAMYDKFLEPMGLSFQEFTRKRRWQKDTTLKPERQFKKYEKAGFGTASGKVELVPSVFVKLGYKIWPPYQEPPRTPISAPEIAKEYPIILTTGGRIRMFYHSTLRQLSRLRELHPDPIIQLHPDLARKHDIKNGDWVYIETPEGRIQQRAEVTEGIDPRVVHAEHGWWFPEEPAEDPSLFGVWKSSLGVILPDEPEYCDYQGGPPMRAVLCKIYKA